MIKHISALNREKYGYVSLHLGDVCTFSCSYCPPRLHDGLNGWNDLKKLEIFIEKIYDHFCSLNKEFIYFELSGGEPTVYPKFYELLELLQQKPKIVLGIISNGNRTMNFWQQSSSYFKNKSIILSYHLEYNYLDHFIELCQFLDNKLNRIHLPMKPDEWEKSVDIFHQLDQFNTMAKPLIVDFDTEIFNYTNIQKDWIQQNSTGSLNVLQTFNDDSIKNITASELIIRKRNSWLNWNCNATLEAIVVKSNGNITSGECGVVNYGKLNDIENITFLTESIICSKLVCSCLSDIGISKNNV